VHDNLDKEYQQYRRSWIELPEKFIIRDFPMHLDIETTSCCNLKCTFCDKLPLLKKNQRGYIDLDLYKKIIDEGAEHKLWGVKLSYRGEPLLHKDICKMVHYAKKNGVLDVYFNTNGMLLSEEVSNELIDAGLNRISISIEGVDAASFEQKRIGAKFDVIKKNIEILLNLRSKKNVNYPKIRIQTLHVSGFNLEQYRNYWVKFCDEVAAVDYKDESKRKSGLVYDWACPQLWQRMTVEWDGTILPCNNDDLRMLSPGNVKDKTIHRCWHDDKINKIRHLHKQGLSHKIEDCNGCPWRTAQINKLIRKGN